MFSSMRLHDGSLTVHDSSAIHASTAKPTSTQPSERSAQSRTELSTAAGSNRGAACAELSDDMAWNGPYAMTETMRSSASLVTAGPCTSAIRM